MTRAAWLVALLALAIGGCVLDVELTPAPDGGVPDAVTIDVGDIDARPIDDAGDDAVGDAAIEPVDAPGSD